VASEPRSHHLIPGAQKRPASSRSDWPVRSTALRRGCDWPVRSSRHCRREHTGEDVEDWYHSCETSIIGIIIINIINAAVESLPPVVNVPGSTRSQRVERACFEEKSIVWSPRGTFRETHCGLQACCMFRVFHVQLHEDADGDAICTEGFVR